MTTIKDIFAREVLDSRNPTVGSMFERTLVSLVVELFRRGHPQEHLRRWNFEMGTPALWERVFKRPLIM